MGGIDEELALRLGGLRAHSDLKVLSSSRGSGADISLWSILGCSLGFRRACLSSWDTGCYARAASASVNAGAPRVPQITLGAMSPSRRGNIFCRLFLAVGDDYSMELAASIPEDGPRLLLEGTGHSSGANGALDAGRSCGD